MPVRQNSYPRRQVRPRSVESEGLTISRLVGSTYNYVEKQGHYARSRSGNSRSKGATLAQLRALSASAPGQICLTHIIDGVVQMTIEVKPPERLKNDPVAQKKAKRIMRALSHPNAEEQRTYKQLISAIVTDLMVGGIATVERQFQDLPPGELSEEEEEMSQEVWQWAVDFNRIQLNKDWTPQNSDVEPRYFDRGRSNLSEKENWSPLMDDDLYTIEQYSNTWSTRPPSPFQVAYEVIQSWLGLTSYQSDTTSKAHQEFLIDLGPVTDTELRAFREFWRTEVQGNGQTPILGTKGSGLNVVKVGAANDDGLYLKYEEKILRLIALIFKLSPRDMNISEPDNRATAGVSADASFQKAILPMASTLLEAFQSNILDKYYPGYRVRFIDTEPRNEAEESATAGELFEKGVITLNEARVRCKEDKLPPAQGNKFKSELAPPEAGKAEGVDQPPAAKQSPRPGAFKTSPAQSNLFH